MNSWIPVTDAQDGTTHICAMDITRTSETDEGLFLGMEDGQWFKVKDSDSDQDIRRFDSRRKAFEALGFE